MYKIEYKVGFNLKNLKYNWFKEYSYLVANNVEYFQVNINIF